MSTNHGESAPLAYENPQFLNSPDGRILRIMSEYTEPLARFRREQIQDTVVFLVRKTPARFSINFLPAQMIRRERRRKPTSIWRATTKMRVAWRIS